jgi:hypothetical protein
MMPADTEVGLILVLVASDLGGGVRQPGIIDVGEGEMAATARQRDSDRASDSAGGSGDDGCAAFELQHDRGPSRRSRRHHFKTGQRRNHWRPLFRRIQQQT